MLLKITVNFLVSSIVLNANATPNIDIGYDDVLQAFTSSKAVQENFLSGYFNKKNLLKGKCYYYSEIGLTPPPIKKTNCFNAAIFLKSKKEGDTGSWTYGQIFLGDLKQKWCLGRYKYCNDPHALDRITASSSSSLEEKKIGVRLG